MSHIVAYDFGTSGVKAALVDYNGNLIASGEKGYPLLTPKKGWDEQRPEDYWTAVCEATKMVVAESGVDPAAVKGLAFSTQGMGIIPVGADGTVLYNNITWLDSRAGDQAIRINEMIGEEYLNANDVVSKLLWIRENMPDLYEKTAYFMDCTGYLSWKCTDVVCMELTRSGPYDLNEKEQEFKQNLYKAAGVDLAKMPPLKTCTEFVGPLTEKAAAELGLTTEAKVYMGTGDVPAACAGAACSEVGDAHIYLGSSGWLSVLKDTERYKNPSPGIYQMYSMNKDQIIYGGCVQSCCLTFDWAINQFYSGEKAAIEKGEMEGYDNIYQYIEDDIEAIPAGSLALLATPWLHGEHCPVMDEKARMTFINITNQHTKSHMMNAVLESIAYSLQGQIEFYNKDSGGKEIKSLTAVGGGALRDKWMQIIADVTGVPVHRTTNVRHAGCMGSAVIAAVGLGLYSIEDASKFINIEKTFEPIPENVEVYKKMYAQFKNVYPALKDIYWALNDDEEE